MHESGRAYLAENGTTPCRHCGYPVSGDPLCTECGNEFTVIPVPDFLPNTQWCLALIFASGLAFRCGIENTIAWFAFGVGETLQRVITFGVALLWIVPLEIICHGSTLAVIAFWVWRRRFTELPPRTQWIIVGVLGGAALGHVYSTVRFLF